jgi:hypothetical protein
MMDELGDPNSYIGVYLMMDDSHKDTIRSVSTLSDALSQTGGFMTVCFLIVLIIVQRFQRTIYFSSLIKSFYRYQPDLISDDENEIPQKGRLLSDSN